MPVLLERRSQPSAGSAERRVQYRLMKRQAAGCQSDAYVVRNAHLAAEGRAAVPGASAPAGSAAHSSRSRSASCASAAGGGSSSRRRAGSDSPCTAKTPIVSLCVCIVCQGRLCVILRCIFTSLAVFRLDS